MAVYPSRMAPIGAKLWENAFRMIWNISFFNAEKIFLAKIKKKSLQVIFCFQETGVLEELGRFERHCHVRRKKLLPLMRLFLGRLPWRGGKRLNMCRKPRLGTESDFNHLDFFVAIFFRGRILFSKRWGFGAAMNFQALLARPLSKVIARTAFIFGETSLERG